MEEDTRDGGILKDHKSTEIQTYLNSFKQELQDESDEGQGNKSDNESTEGKDTHKKSKKSQEIITYYGSADGTLYSASSPQSALPQAVTVLAGGDEQNQTDGSVSGLHHMVFTIGESGNLVLNDSKALSYAIPMAISSQGTLCKENYNLHDDSTKPQTVMVMQSSNNLGRENVIPLRSNTQNLISQVGSEFSNCSQIFQMVTDADQTAIKNSLVADGNATMVRTDESYQTVTVMPQDNSGGPLSYVLILSQPQEEGCDTKAEENANVPEYIEGEYAEVEKDCDKFEIMTVDGEIEGEIEVEKPQALKETSQSRPVANNHHHSCPHCDYTSAKRYLLSRHLKSHSDDRPHKCNVCQRGFKTMASLQNHVNTHTKTRPHACKDCESCFTTSGELVRHMRYKHTHEKPHRCMECDYASVELSKLKRHMRCHTGERPYQCPHCTYASPDTYKLKRHMRIHTGEKPYVCDVCQSRFTQSNSLKAHRQIHSGDKPSYPCLYCPTTCGRKTDLRIHVQKLHSCDKMHKCKRCGKIFKDRYSFKLHCKTHDGEKSFKCVHCPYATISIHQLEAHCSTHVNEEELYQCLFCDLSFGQKALLKQHIAFTHNQSLTPSKEKNIECAECGKMFRHHGNMMRHLVVHDPKASLVDREEAMQIGRTKEPGEIRDGEEDELSDDDINNDDVVVFELIDMAKFPENGAKMVTTSEGQILTLDGSNSEGYTLIPASPSDDMQTEPSSPSEAVNVNELKAPLRIDFEGDNSESEVNGNYNNKRKVCGNEETNPNKLAKCSRIMDRSPQIIQISAQSQKVSGEPSQLRTYSKLSGKSHIKIEDNEDDDTDDEQVQGSVQFAKNTRSERLKLKNKLHVNM